MKKLAAVIAVFALALPLAAAVFAGDTKENAKDKAGDAVTLEGTMVCAKCTLNEDRKQCQDVLQTKTDKGEANYYIVKNDVSNAFGHVCKDTKNVIVTGTVTEKDGAKWIDASKMEEKKS